MFSHKCGAIHGMVHGPPVHRSTQPPAAKNFDCRVPEPKHPTCAACCSGKHRRLVVGPCCHLLPSSLLCCKQQQKHSLVLSICCFRHAVHSWYVVPAGTCTGSSTRPSSVPETSCVHWAVSKDVIEVQCSCRWSHRLDWSIPEVTVEVTRLKAFVTLSASNQSVQLCRGSN